MSCSQPDPLDQTGPERVVVASTSTSTKCRRCSLPAIAFILAGSYCSTCFEAYLYSKFKRSAEGVRYFSRTGTSMDHSPLSGRRQLQPRREEGAGGVIRHVRSRVLLGMSGGVGSRVLLELLKAWFPNRDPSSKAPPAFQGLLVVHVEIDTEEGQAHQEKAFTEDLKTLVDSIGIKDVKFMSIPLSDIFKDPNTPESTSQTALERHQKLVQLLHPTTPSPTPTPSKNKIDYTSLASLQRSLLFTLLRRKAREEKCEVLVTGEGSDRVAELTIEGMALGKGYTIGEEVGVEWEVSEGEGEKAYGNGLLVARPVSGILRAEMEELVRVKRLVVPRPDRGEAAYSEPTIQAVVTKFVKGLQEEFPSTVQTVLATVHKLGMRSTDARMRMEEEGRMGSESWKGCAICGGPVQEGAHRWRTAITMSDLFETDHASVTRSIEDAELQTAPIGINESKHDDSANSLDSSLCYSCLSIPKAIAKTEDLPSYVERQRWSKGRMDDVVKEFLIEE